MVDKQSNTTIPPASGNDRNLSQVVFVTIGLGIISGGLWSLYMGDAPYHPGMAQFENAVYLAAE